VRMAAIAGPKARAWWFNPRTGAATEAGTFPTSTDHRFTPPDPGEALDWVLVLDDAAKSYGTPGARSAVPRPRD
jgi:collagenase-like protein with putative collagen-binding domain